MHGEEFIVDLWSRLKPFISSKDRLDAADAIVAICDEYGYIDDNTTLYAEFADKELKAAFKTQFSEHDDEEEYDDDSYGW